MEMPWIPDKLRDPKWSFVEIFRGNHYGTRVLKMRYAPTNPQQYEVYAVKVIDCPSEDVPAALAVQLDEPLIYSLAGKPPWVNFVHIKAAWKESRAITPKFCIIMDWKGNTLSYCLYMGFRFSGPPWFDVMRGIVNGVSQPHLNGSTHGDLKPSNILVNIDNVTGAIPFDDVFVSDLGVRHWRSVYSRKLGQMMRIPGSQRYVAPEVLQEGQAALTTAADIWAIGCIGYELIAGNPLFESDDDILAYVETNSLDPNKAAIIGAHPNIRRVLENCLDPKQENRWNVWVLLGNLGQAS